MLTQLTKARPSSAMIVAAVALTLALTGSAVAGTDTATRSLSKSAVAKIAKTQANAVVDTRAASLDVNSAKTAQNAVNAQNAATAQNATAVGGIQLAEIDYRGAAQSAAQTIFQGSGLTITAECQASTEIVMLATTSKADASIYASHTATDFDVDNTTTNDSESGAFDLGDEFQLLTTSDTSLTDSGLTTFEYDAPDGTSISGVFSTDESTVGPQPNCQAHGHLTVS